MREDLENSEEEMKPVVEAFQEEYGDDVPRLIELLDEPDTMDALLAIKRLGELHAIEAVEPLVRVVRRPSIDLLPAAAIIVLGELGDSRAVQPLIDVVNNAEERAARETDNMRPPAGWRGVLSRMMAGKWWTDIREDSRKSLRLIYLRNGISALGKLGDKRAIEPIRRRLGDPDERVQAAAAEALQRLEST